MKTDQTEISGNPISRKDALKKAGKYAAFTAAASVLLLVPKQAQAQSPQIRNPGENWGSSSYTPPSNQSPFVIPDDKTSSSGLRETPWK